MADVVHLDIAGIGIAQNFRNYNWDFVVEIKFWIVFVQHSSRGASRPGSQFSLVFMNIAICKVVTALLAAC